MKRNCLLLASLFLLSALCAHAQLAIYKTTGHQTVIGGGSTTKLTTHGYMVIDLAAVNGTSINAFTLNGQKRFVVVQMQNYHLVSPESAKGTYNVLAKAEAPSSTDPNTLLESSFIQGKAVTVNITPAGPISVPRSMTSVGQSIVDPVGVLATSVATGSGSLDIKGSMAANVGGLTIDDVVSNITNELLSRGYVQSN